MHAGHKVLMEVYDNIFLLVVDPVGINLVTLGEATLLLVASLLKLVYISKFFVKNVHHFVLPLNLLILNLATLGDATQIGSFLFV